jgi:hypothetical protein
MFAEGGFVQGPGDGFSDSIDAKLSNGEYVINAESTRKFLPLLDQINFKGSRMPMIPYMPNIFGSRSDMMTADILKTMDTRLSQVEGTPVKAYVVASDMTSQQEADNKLSQLARLD